MVVGDELRVEQALENLVSNALKYSSGTKNAEVNVSLVQRDQVFTLSVSDNGIGIPSIEQAKIFTQFYRAKNAQTKFDDGMI